MTGPDARIGIMAESDMLEAAIGAFTLFVVGSVDDTGAIVLSRDGRTPTDDTIVFLASDPDAEMTLADAESTLGVVTWLAEPEPYDGNPASPLTDIDLPLPMIDDDQAWTPMMAAIADPSEEAIAAERQAAVKEVERRVGQLEGMVAEIMLGEVADEAFGSSPADEIVVERPMPRYAALGAQLAGLATVAARIAAMDDKPDTDLDDRLAAVLERLDKLESTITDLMDDKIADDELDDVEPDESGTVVDETMPPPKTAAFFTNARGVRVWHDPNTGKFAPAGFVSLDVLRRLFNGSPEARTELTDALRKARKADPKLTLRDAPDRVLGPRPSDREGGLHWDAAKRSLFSSWRRSTPVGAKPGRETLRADRIRARRVPAGARPEMDPVTGEPSDTDFSVAEFRNGDVNFYLSYAADADEYQLVRSPNDPRGIDEVSVESGKFPMGTSAEEVAATLASRAGFDDFRDALDAELTDRALRPPDGTLTADRMTAGPVMRPMDGPMSREALRQIGTMNVMAISGGRSSVDAKGRLILPVAAGYRVRVSLAANDTYSVERVFSRGGTDFVKGRVDTVYASELGEVAYRASNFRDSEPFGDSTLTANQMVLVEPTGIEVFEIDRFISDNPQGDGEDLFAWQGRIVESLPPDVQSEVLFQIRETYDPSPRVAAGLERWQREHGLPSVPAGIADERVDLDEADRAAFYFESAPDASDDPEVQAAYADFVRQSEEMWDFLTRPESEGGMGITVEFTDRPDPYPTAEAQRDDIENNGHLWIERGLGGDHSATVTDEQYDRFRAVHDVFGHAGIGSGFDRHGEYQAWLVHAAMYSGLGRRAMSTEYHGVNSASWAGAPGTPGTGKSVLLPDEMSEPPWLRSQRLGEYSDSYLLQLWTSDKSPSIRAELVRRGLLAATAAMGDDKVGRLLSWLGVTPGTPEAVALARRASRPALHSR